MSSPRLLLEALVLVLVAMGGGWWASRDSRPEWVATRDGAFNRTEVRGPTVGDAGGASVLDGSGYWAAAFRAIRRS